MRKSEKEKRYAEREQLNLRLTGIKILETE
jgi:hypothetical protein